MVTIQRAKKKEIPEIRQFLSYMWDDTYGTFLPPLTIEKIKKVWHDPNLLLAQIEDHDFLFDIAKDGDKKIIGLTTARKSDDATLVIGRLYVHPEYQRQGIGKRMLDMAIKAFPYIRKIQVEVIERNAKGINFYLGQGFTKLEMKQEKVEDTILDVIVMGKCVPTAVLT